MVLKDFKVRVGRVELNGWMVRKCWEGKLRAELREGKAGRKGRRARA